MPKTPTKEVPARRLSAAPLESLEDEAVDVPVAKAKIVCQVILSIHYGKRKGVCSPLDSVPVAVVVMAWLGPFSTESPVAVAEPVSVGAVDAGVIVADATQPFRQS